MKRFMLIASLLFASQCHAIAPSGNDTIILYSPDESTVYSFSGCNLNNDVENGQQAVYGFCNSQSIAKTTDQPPGGGPLAFIVGYESWVYDHKYQQCMLIHQVELATYTAYTVSCTISIFKTDFEDHSFGAN